MTIFVTDNKSKKYMKKPNFSEKLVACLTRNIETKQLHRTYKLGTLKRLQEMSKYSSGLKTKRGKPN